MRTGRPTAQMCPARAAAMPACAPPPASPPVPTRTHGPGTPDRAAGLQACNTVARVDSDAAREARTARIFGQAAELAKWLGDDKRRLTPSGVLRRPDVPAAAAVLGVTVPAKLRSAADIGALNRPWAFGVGAGLIDVAAGSARAGSGTDLDGMSVLDRWAAGARAVLAAEPHMDSDTGLLAILATLEVLDGEKSGQSQPFEWRVSMRKYDVAERYALTTDYVHIDWDSFVPLLTDLGVVAGKRMKITTLGRWACRGLARGLAVPADPALSAAELITELSRFDTDRVKRHVLSGWLEGREPAAAVREILTVADSMSSAERAGAIRIAAAVTDAADSVWQEMSATACVGPHAMMILHAWGLRDDVPEAALRWLVVEQAAVEVAAGDPDEALTFLAHNLPGDDLDTILSSAAATSHPEVEAVTKAVLAFVESGAPRTIDTALQLKVSLSGFRPPIWRRIQLPASFTLAELHEVIQVLFGWDGDHQYLFTVGKRQYSGAFGHLEETGYDDEIRITEALSAVKTIEYIYDLGEYWEHEVTLEKRLPADPEATYPVCVEFAGDSPVEYPEEDWDDEDDGAESEPFDIAEINRRLTGDDQASGRPH